MDRGVDQYTVIPIWMHQLKIKGNALLIFAHIYSICKNTESHCYYGSISYLCDRYQIARSSVIDSLAKLVEEGYLNKVIQKKDYGNAQCIYTLVEKEV